MSTTEDASAVPGTHHDPVEERPVLPTLRHNDDPRDRRTSHAESSTSGSRWSTANPHSRSPSDHRAGSSVMGSDDSRRDHPSSSSFKRRIPNRSSGGFLIEPMTHSSRLSKALLSQTNEDVKGKRKSEQPEISLPKRSNKPNLPNRDPSLRGSPLSVEVRVEDDSQQNTKSNPESIKKGLHHAVVQNGASQTPVSQRSVAPSFGFDSDPAQIVDMALKLNEGRRRQASGKRYVSGNNVGGSPAKRVVSAASSRQIRTPTKKVGRYITTPQDVTSPPLPDSSLTNGVISQSGDPMMVDDPFSSSLADSQDKFMADDVDISRATTLRVEKAKVYLELAYEHRRLLSHLPPVRRPDQPVKASDPVSESKTYNPLQYARNRKLRLREKSGINAEAEGWHDIQKVRAWVDAVTTSHTETSYGPMECVRLPPLSLREEEEDEPLSPTQRTSPGNARTQPAKPRRPKSDWVTHPGDLIADAFWLEQGLNKTKIQDRDNNPIFPPDTAFKFSGWRNRTPVHVPERLQEPTPPPEPGSVSTKTPPLDSAPQLPTFRSAHKKEKDESRGRKQAKLKTSRTKPHSGSHRRKLALLDSSSGSGSDSDRSIQGTDDENKSRGRKRKSNNFDLPDGDPFSRPIRSIYPDSQTNGFPSSSDANLSGQDSKRSSIDNSRLVTYLKRNSVLKPPSQDRGRSRGHTKKNSHSFFSHHRGESKDYDKRTLSSAEDDSTAPNSPAHYGLPSIAINLDAPLSRSPSPTKKSKPSLLSSWKDKSKQSEFEKIETNDFAKRQSKSHSRETSIDGGRTRDSSNHTSRGTSPFTRLRRESTAQDELPPTIIDHRSSTISQRSIKPLPHDHQSRIRGMFKGGRIAELVGNEVSRVGDYIWKRDVPPAYRQHMADFDAKEASDTDESVQNGPTYRTPSRDLRRSVSSQSSSGGRRSYEMPAAKEKNKLHNPNLPSFTSPFQRDRDRQEHKPSLLTPENALSADDPISRQAAQHRTRSKSPRLDRLAPPKLDTSAPRSVGVLERRNSYGFGTALGRSQSASRAFNDAIASGKHVSARSSGAGLPSGIRSSVDNIRMKSGSGVIDKQDLPRVEALLMISAVKARNIIVSHEQIPDEASTALVQSLTAINKSVDQTSLLQVRKRDQHAYAAQQLIMHLGQQSFKINNQLEAFSNETVGLLHKEIQILEDQIENTITPRVRRAADDAGDLSVKLTTTSTQAVKGMQDAVSEAFRLRRRGPFRWMRLLWYTMIEWFVVGLLWFIWAIVTVVRIFLGSIKGVVRVARWLLWID